eukprot:scaffold167038_cov35-Tisochrysis_lutea.AAC.4
MQRRLREEELKVLRGQAKVDERSIEDALESEAANTRIKRPAGASVRGRGGGGGGGVYGGMVPEESESDDDDDLGEEESGEGGSEVCMLPIWLNAISVRHVPKHYSRQEGGSTGRVTLPGGGSILSPLEIYAARAITSMNLAKFHHCVLDLDKLSSLAIHSQDEFGGEGYEPNSTSHGLGGEFELDEGESEEGGDDDDDF